MQNTIKIIREALSGACQRGSAGVADGSAAPLYDDREIRAICDLLLEEVCSITRADRIMHPDLVLPDAQRQRLLSIAGQLRQGVPVQQALGYEWFCGARFEVSPDVLIPRPETAELVEWILTCCQGAAAPLSICDVGTGSGCIAISLARLVEGSQVVALDVSEAALSIARRNAYQQGVENLQFAHCDILAEAEAADGESVINKLSTACQRLDILVSNPPYICQREAAGMSANVVDHEPHLALFVPDDDPLLFYRAIARFGLRNLRPGGQLFFEINAAYGAATCALLSELGYRDVELRQDINGRDRMIRAII